MAPRVLGICPRCGNERPLSQTFGVCRVCREAQRKGRKVFVPPVIGTCSRCERERKLYDGVCAKCRDLTKRGHLPRRSAEWRKKIGDAQRGEKNHAYKGGRSIDSNGYVWVLADGDLLAEDMLTSSSKGYVQEHRLVMARALGRPLRRGETVHHINGDRADNRLGNLQRRMGAHGAGVVLQCQACGSHDVEAVPLADFNAAHSAAV